MSQTERMLRHEIRAITFDVGGTLIAPWPSVGDVYAQVAAEQGISGLTPALLNGRFVNAWKALGARAESREDWLAVVRSVFGGMDQVEDVQTLFEALYDRFTEPRVWKVFDDVVPTLELLQKQGIRLAIISNWDERLRPLLKRLRLAQYFGPILVSCEVGCRKPKPEIFVRAAAALGMPATAVLHVGDCEHHDVAGAVGAGMRALLIRRAGSGVDSSISTLATLPDALKGR